MDTKVIELQDFVAQSLTQIINGVKQAQSAIGNSGGEINPALHKLNPNSANLIGWQQIGIYPDAIVYSVDFDLALTTSVGDGTKAGIGVFSGIFGAGAQTQISKEELQLSRLKFSVPISLPIHGHSK